MADVAIGSPVVVRPTMVGSFMGVSHGKRLSKDGELVAYARVRIKGLPRMENVKKIAHTAYVKIDASSIPSLEFNFPRLEVCFHRYAIISCNALNSFLHFHYDMFIIQAHLFEGRSISKVRVLHSSLNLIFELDLCISQYWRPSLKGASSMQTERLFTYAMLPHEVDMYMYLLLAIQYFY